MLIHFTSNASVTDAGWSAGYTCTQEYQGPCIDEIFTALTGTLSDNSGPENYTNDMNCEKLIQPAGAATITLTFTAFDIESGYDFVTVFDGDKQERKEIGIVPHFPNPLCQCDRGGEISLVEKENLISYADKLIFLYYVVLSRRDSSVRPSI